MLQNLAHYPTQKLPLSKKNEEWRKGCLDYFIGSSYVGHFSGRAGAYRKAVNYDLYNSRLNRKDLEYVTNPFGVDEDMSFPANLHNFNIIRPKIDLLLGEEIKRPFNWRVVCSDYGQASLVEEEHKRLLFDSVTQMFLNEVQQLQEPGSEPQQQPQLPEDISKYMRYSYSDIYEKAANSLLKYLNKYIDLPEEFMLGWKDALITGEEIYYVGNYGKEPFVERINPLYFDFDRDPMLIHIEDGEWCVRKIRMSSSAIIDRFGDDLTESDMEWVLEKQAMPTTAASDVNYQIIRRDYSGDAFENFAANLINVWHATWKSYKKVGYLKYEDENGDEQEVMVSEDYKPDKGEKVEWDWKIEIWEGYRIGDQIYCGVKPTNYQKLPYVGALYSRTNSNNVSLVDLMKPLQYMYIIIWYRLDLALARDKGKVINIDVTQIPKSMGIDFKQWAHYLSALGVNLINPYEEGWDIKRGGAAASFNQFSSIDLTMANVIQGYIMLLAKIESMVGEISGISQQRQGSISTNELVGNVERAIVQSSLITESLFWQHNQVKKRVMQTLLDVAKDIYAEHPTKKLQYILDDMSRSIITIPDEFNSKDYNVFVTDSSKENRIIESLRSLSEVAMQSGASLYDVSIMHTTDSIAEIQNKLKEISEQKDAMMQQQGEIQKEVMSQKINAEMQFRQAELDFKERDSQRKADTQIKTAIIGAESRNEEGSSDLDEREIELKARKLTNDFEYDKESLKLKQRELDIKERQNKNKPNNSKK